MTIQVKDGNGSLVTVNTLNDLLALLPVALGPTGGLKTDTPLSATIVSGQIKIAATGTAVQLPSNALVNGIVIKARSLNAAAGFVGSASVTRTDDGTGNGFALLPGEAMSYATSNSSAVWINGTIGDVFYYGGN